MATSLDPRRSIHRLALALLLFAAGTVCLVNCGEERPGPSKSDAALELDAGLERDGSEHLPDADASETLDDAGVEHDAGLEEDASEPPPDAGEPADASNPRPDAGPLPDAGDTVRVRMLAGNLTTGGAQNYDNGEGIRIFQGLQPDIAMIQEFNFGDNTEAAIRGFVDTAFGSDFYYYREPIGPKDSIPNGIISRYPILSAGEWNDPMAEDRDFAWARVDVPGAKDLLVVSVHMPTTDNSHRNGSATAAVAMLGEVMVPGELLVFGGDFNTDKRTEYCVATVLAAVLSTAAPYPVDQANDGDTSSPRTKPFDWVLVNSELRAYEVPVVIGENSFANGLVFDSRVYTPLYDVEPVLASDCAAAGMQHMAVVRDFALPE